jgi:hypothetical protein
MIRKSGYHFSGEIMLKAAKWRMIFVAEPGPLRRIMR